MGRRFSPFNFSVVPGFPNVVPTMDEWGDLESVKRTTLQSISVSFMNSCINERYIMRMYY